jgi:hypothetical protein
MTTNPEIQKLARLEKDKQEVSWVRLYQLPPFVFFSHQKHIDAEVNCAVCHGAVGGRDVLRREKDISMVSCVNCHQLRKVPTTCSTCHVAALVTTWGTEPMKMNPRTMLKGLAARVQANAQKAAEVLAELGIP